MKCLVFLFLFLLLVAGSAEAVTRYVDPVCPNGIAIYNPTAAVGSRCGGGSSTVYTTIANGVAATFAGDTLLIRAGTYNQVIDNRAQTVNSGTSLANPVTIAAYPGNCVTLGVKGPGGGCETVTLTGSANPAVLAFGGNGSTIPQIQYVVVDGLRLAAPNSNYGISPGSNMIFKNIDICCAGASQGRDGQGIFVGGNNTGNLFQNIIIHDLSPDISPVDSSLASHGMYWAGGSNTADGLLIYNVGGYGIQFYPPAASNNNIVKNSIIHNTNQVAAASGGGIISYGSNNVIYNNVLYNGENASAAIDMGPNGIAYNNTIFNYQYGFMGNAGTNSRMVNNIIYQSRSNDIYTANGLGDATFAKNWCTSAATGCDFTGNPLFVSSATGNFNLQVGSAAINVGNSNVAPGIVIPACSGGIILGCYNGTAPDLGALETGVPTAGGGPPTLTPNLTSVAAGQEIKVTVDDDDVNERTENTGDYVGIYTPGAASTAFVDWFYMNNTKTAPTTAISDAVITFTAPSTPGTYEFRFYQNGSTLEADRLTTATFTVVPAGIVIKFVVSTMKIGPSVTWKIGVP